jgi:hypothetical protein
MLASLAFGCSELTLFLGPHLGPLLDPGSATLGFHEGGFRLIESLRSLRVSFAVIGRGFVNHDRLLWGN